MKRTDELGVGNVIIDPPLFPKGPYTILATIENLIPPGIFGRCNSRMASIISSRPRPPRPCSARSKNSASVG
jgi:hypothetical protein